MKLLPEKFTKKGFVHQQVWREGNIAIYRRGKEGGIPHYECIVIRVQKERATQTPSGAIMLPHQELYPAAEKWGQLGWTYHTYEEARARAEKLLEKAV